MNDDEIERLLRGMGEYDRRHQINAWIFLIGYFVAGISAIYIAISIAAETF